MVNDSYRLAEIFRQTDNQLIQESKVAYLKIQSWQFAVRSLRILAGNRSVAAPRFWPPHERFAAQEHSRRRGGRGTLRFGLGHGPGQSARFSRSVAHLGGSHVQRIFPDRAGPGQHSRPICRRDDRRRPAGFHAGSPPRRRRGTPLGRRTPLGLVSVADGYFPLRTGDKVQFIRIDEAEFRRLQGQRLETQDGR